MSYDSFIESERAVAEVSLDGCWLRTNNALCKLLGYEAHELKSMRVRDVTHPEDRALSVNIVDQALRHYERFQQELKRYVRKDGAVVWVLLQTTLKRDAEGEPTHFLSFLEDVTYRVAHEPLARAIAARMQSLQEQEKARIARELHDQLGQSLSALKFEVSWLKSKLPEGSEAHAARLTLSIDSILRSVRQLWKGLRPPILDELGLEAAIDWLLQENCGLQGIPWQLVRPDRPLRLDSRTRLGLFRVCEAGLHLLLEGALEQITVTLSVDPEQIRLDLDWEGELQVSSSHAGVVAMNDQALQLKGTLTCDENEQNIRLRVPRADASPDNRKVPPHWE
ncbi:MAG: PAS domain S-box protein [Candidatus Eremiobacteraeota bacterium]|nr:PAS domain S-box protein [Candidatus Eremiobacteraeota bacterium]